MSEHGRGAGDCARHRFRVARRPVPSRLKLLFQLAFILEFATPPRESKHFTTHLLTLLAAGLRHRARPPVGVDAVSCRCRALSGRLCGVGVWWSVLSHVFICSSNID